MFPIQVNYADDTPFATFIASMTRSQTSQYIFQLHALARTCNTAPAAYTHGPDNILFSIQRYVNYHHYELIHNAIPTFPHTSENTYRWHPSMEMLEEINTLLTEHNGQARTSMAEPDHAKRGKKIPSTVTNKDSHKEKKSTTDRRPNRQRKQPWPTVHVHIAPTISRVARPELPCDFHGDLMPPGDPAIHRATPHKGRMKGSTCKQCKAQTGYQCFDTIHTPKQWLERQNQGSAERETTEEPPEYQPAEYTQDDTVDQTQCDLHIDTSPCQQWTRLRSQALNDPVPTNSRSHMATQQHLSNTAQAASPDTAVSINMGTLRLNIKMNQVAKHTLIIITIMVIIIWTTMQNIYRSMSAP